ncbi:MAG: fumarate hydratase, partial [Promethearchaeota archaeon]
MRASELEDVFVTLLRMAVTDLPQDVVNGLEQALKLERNSTAKSQLEAILENIKLARQHSIPMCQDTGIQIFYLTVGSKFPLITEIPQILQNAVRRGTQEVPLRP